MLQAYSYFSSKREVDLLLVPDFYYHVKCMYDMMAIKQGIDPDKPSEEITSAPGAQQGTRKVSGAEAIALLNEWNEKKEKAKEEKADIQW